MEDVFDQLIEESHSSKFPEIHRNACQAKGILESSSSLAQCSQSDLRKVCFAAFSHALKTKVPKLVSLAILGMNKLLRDDQFYGKTESSDESTWLVSQLMDTINPISSHPEDVQVELVKIILSMCCLPKLALSGRIIVELVDMCGLAYGRGSSALKVAGQSAAIQAIAAFLGGIKIECEAKDFSGNVGPDSLSDDISPPAYDEIVPIIYFIAEKLTETHKLREDKKSVEIPSVFLLECAKSLIQLLTVDTQMTNQYHRKEYSVPPYCSTFIISALWQRLCPSLIALLGTPVSMSVGRGSGRMQGQSGRGSGGSSTSLIFDLQEAKAIYSVSCSLVIAMGNVGEMRPILESLFHRMLLYPPPYARHDAIKIVIELFRSPYHLSQLAGPILFPDPRNPYQCDLGLFRLILDSLTECANGGDFPMQMIIIEGLCNLFASLETICKGTVLTTAQISHINLKYESIEDVDYTGPLIYGNHLGISNYRYSEMSLPDESGYMAASESSNYYMTTDTETGDESVSINVSCEEYSNSSGDTEGPEEIDSQILEEVQQNQIQEEERLKKLSENLGSWTNLNCIGDDDHRKECENARKFCGTLCSLLPSLLEIRSTIEVDQAIIEFSSKYCQGVFSQFVHGSRPLIINADGIYLATYCCLSLNLKLITNGFYCEPGKPPAMTKEQFIDTVFARGVLVYVSSSWVGELYEQILKDSFLQRAGYTHQSPYNCALINLLTGVVSNLRAVTLSLFYCMGLLEIWLKSNIQFCLPPPAHDFDISTFCIIINNLFNDMDGLGNIEEGSQMISDYRRLAQAAKKFPKTNAMIAGQKLARRIVTCCWESVLSIESTLLKKLEDKGGILMPLRLLLAGENSRKEESRKAQDLLISCLGSLQACARLANLLGLQKRCGLVFALLSSACLPKDERNIVGKSKRTVDRSLLSWKPLRLHRAHILSFHVMMECGLELGSHTSDCWSHMFRCSLYLAELERKFFKTTTTGYSRNLLGHTKDISKQKSVDSSFPLVDEQYSFTNLPKGCNETVESILAEAEAEISSSGFLTPQHSERILSCLTMLVDRFFESAANQLNLSALESFLKELCSASQNQLFRRPFEKSSGSNFMHWSRKKLTPKSVWTDEDNFAVETLLLHRLGDSMLKIVKSGRPLIHIMRVWSIVGPHFLEAACHKDNKVSKKAISCIHDVVNNLLGNQVELPHFHFNEALFKPFENLLCLELCDLEVQDQIVCSICEFVESCNSDIKSGWRPLFGALKCVRPSSPGLSADSSSHLGVVKDIFEAFLSTDNVLVFANAALDCILCLLKHVKGSGDADNIAEDDLCIDALKYLHRIAVILTSMGNMPACPMFITMLRLFDDVIPSVVDVNIPYLDQSELRRLRIKLLENQTNSYIQVDYDCLWPEQSEPLLSNLDSGTGILHIWYVLLEGLVGAAMSARRHYQTQIVDALFGIVVGIDKCPGAEFGLYSINHLILPSMQEWLRKCDHSCGNQAFKHYVGLASDTFVAYINNKSVQELPSCQNMLLLMLQQVFVVLTECINHPSDIGRLACSCIRHIILSCGESFTESQWQIVVHGIHRVSQVSLFPLLQLMENFYPKSLNFYGDVGQIKVAARRDCTPEDVQKLKYLTLQVFQLDEQHADMCTSDDTDRSFIFLIYSDPKQCQTDDINDDESIRVEFKSLIFGLLANQMILQILGTILVQGSHHVVPSLANVLLQPSTFGQKGESSNVLPGMLKWLTSQQILVLLDNLDQCFKASIAFDDRPGLKFLVQKVAQTNRAANLYKQSGASWTLRVLTIFDLILAKVQEGLDIKCVKNVLEKEAKEKHTIRHRPSSLQLPSFDIYIQMLSESFCDLCETYLQLVSSDESSKVDNLHDQPLFFLTIPADEFPTSHRANIKKWTLNDSHDTDIEPSDCGNALPNKMTLGAFGSEVETKSFAFGDWVDKDSSDSDSSEPTKDDSAEESVKGITESVYCVATDKQVSKVMDDYRRHKNKHSISIKKPGCNREDTAPSESLPPQIEAQRTTSLMKDGEAHVKIWTEMIVTVFDLISQLNDAELRPILPLVFPTMQSLTAHAQDSHLRQVVAEMLGRVALLYGFSPSE